MGKEIKGENGRDKRKVLGREKGDFGTFDPGKLKERKLERKEKRRRRGSKNLSQNNTILTKGKEILYSKELTSSNHL